MLLGVAGQVEAVSYSAQEIELVRLINEYRVANGVDALLVSDTLSDSAEKHSQDMADYDFFGHVTQASSWFPVGSVPSARMVACGYPSGHWTGENISGGWETPTAMMTGWKQSDGHKKNMLDARWTVIGVGLVVDPTSEWGTYCTTDFGSYVDGSAHENGGTLPPDTTPPTVSITAPAQGSDVRGSVTVTATANDNRGIAHVDLYVNGAFVAKDNGSPYAIVWDSSTAPNGSCTLEVRAYDTSNNQASATRVVYVTDSTATSTVTSTTTTTSTTSTTTSTTTTSTTNPPVTTTTTVVGSGFRDVPSRHPFYQPIMVLNGAGIVSGFQDGFFRPNSPVTRAQFTKIIILALDEHTPAVDNADDPTFSDVRYTGNAYPFDYIEEASAEGIISGRGDHTFGPTEKVTRLQLAMMLVRAGGADLPTPPTGYKCPFTDVPAYARSDVAKAYFNGILSGKSSKLFDPYSSATRGQVAKMVYSLCKILQKVS
jgi:uncharacterized protein YkwD